MHNIGTLEAAARGHLLDIFGAALGAVHGRVCVAQALRDELLAAPVYVVAIGKAAAAMYEGASETLGAAIAKALVITKYHHLNSAVQADPRVLCKEAGHPLPDAASLDAGRALLAFLDDAPGDATMLFLISGGASALVEVLPYGVDASDLQRVNDWLLASGLDITQINQVRRALSMVKGGRLAERLQGRRALNLLISDVPDDSPATIGSGLLVPPRPALFKLDELGLPPWLASLLHLAPEAPAADSDWFAAVDTRIVASLSSARQEAAARGRQLGYDVYLHEDVIACDAEETGRRLARQLLDGPPLLHVWGGETTVQLPEQPGRGGRNQHLALSAALVLQGRDDVFLLAAGTDGTDGPTDDAGALVDGGTIARGEAGGCDAAASLLAMDSGRFLAAAGDLIRTGATGTNVMDLVLGLKLR